MRVDAMPVLLVDQIARAIVDAGVAQRVVAGVSGKAQRGEGKVRKGRARRVVGRRRIDGRRSLRAVIQHLVGEEGLQIIGRLP